MAKKTTAGTPSAGVAPDPDLQMKGKSVMDQPMPPLFRMHGAGPRSEILQPVGATARTGKFGRMFPSLQPLEPPEESLRQLAAAMVDANPNSRDGDNPDVPAGYTYLGQFIDHDITFDTTSLQETRIDPLAVVNFRSPMLDLDCVYGAGPVAQPYLYQRATPTNPGAGFLFEIGRTQRGGGDPSIDPDKPNDLPRGPNKFALIGDPRNDENLIVQQLHLAFLKFHNKVVAGMHDGTIPRDSPLRKSVFEEARDLVIWHYQWIVLNDFLPRLIDKKVLKDVRNNGRDFYRFEDHDHPYLPVEFSGAAYRLGHSMVREEYDYNRVFSLPPQGGLPSGSLRLLFNFTGLSGDGNAVPTPSDWIIDWRRFFDLGDREPGLSRKLDPFTAPMLANIPAVPKPFSLPERNLIRGLRLRLPPGQSIARFMGLTPLAPNEVASGPDGAVAKEHNLHVESPLWYYVLKEAQIQGNGRHLGEVGSRILAEVFVGLLEADSSSFLVRRPTWTPTLGKTEGVFGMADLIQFVGDVNPIGDAPTPPPGGSGPA